VKTQLRFTLFTDILHHSQQDLKNRVYQRIIKVFRLQQSQETQCLVLVQDMSLERAIAPGYLTAIAESEVIVTVTLIGIK
jgi:hypothetical protein